MSQEKQLLQYFQIYCKFLSIDLYTSVRPARNKLNGERGGRNVILLYKFFEVFYNIYLEEYEPDVIDKNISSLKGAIEEHIRVSGKAEGLQKILKCEDINDVNLDDNDILQIFNANNKYLFEEFYRMVKVFKKHINQYPEIKSHFSHEGMHPVLGQGLIEFHNAMSHLTFVAREKKCNTNVRRAMSHVFRGILDNIKAIVKNLNLDDEQKILLIKTRAYEFGGLGTEVKIDGEQKNQKLETIKMYNELLLELLSSFPRNKVYKQKVETKSELRARSVNNRQQKKR